jgi:hypothetical protein
MSPNFASKILLCLGRVPFRLPLEHRPQVYKRIAAERVSAREYGGKASYPTDCRKPA